MTQMNVFSVTGLSIICASLACTPLLDAKVIAYDNIPENMNAGGSNSDPAQYILGEVYPVEAYVAEESAYVGSTTSYNELIVRNGSTLRVRFGNAYIGQGASASNNAMTISGLDSKLTVMSDVYVGENGSNNRLIIQSQATSNLQSLYIGNNASSNGNEVSVAGPGSSLSMSSGLHLGRLGSTNRMTISDGGSVDAGSVYIGANANANNNALLLSGTGSLLDASGVTVGRDSINNTLTVEDGALLKVSGDTFTVDADDNSFIGVDGHSYIALQGNRLDDVYAMIEAGDIRYKDEVTYEWMTLNPGESIGDHFSVVYYANADGALAGTGYAAMGDYTFIRTGTMVPEPATYALILGAAMAGFSLMRNHRRK